MTLEEKRRRILERRLAWLEDFYTSWRFHEGRSLYNKADRELAKADYEAMREAIIAEGKEK